MAQFEIDAPPEARSAQLTGEELAVVALAGHVAERFSKLPVLHRGDLPDVAFHVHAIQNIVMARLAYLAHPDEFPPKP